MSRNACASVFTSHHCPHRFALLQQQFGDRPPYRANTPRGAGDQNGILHVMSSAEHAYRKWFFEPQVVLF
jgi:hypothetical protein